MTSGPPRRLSARPRNGRFSERGHDDARIVDEAREHLVDAVEDGVAAASTAPTRSARPVERFGPPGVIAAQAPPQESA